MEGGFGSLGGEFVAKRKELWEIMIIIMIISVVLLFVGDTQYIRLIYKSARRRGMRWSPSKKGASPSSSQRVVANPAIIRTRYRSIRSKPSKRRDRRGH